MKKIYFLLFLGFTASAQIAITQPETPYSQNFNEMGPTGTSFPIGWTAVRSSGTGTPGETLTMLVSNGSLNQGGIHNVGTTDNADRALGTLTSNPTVPAFGASFINNTGSAITNITIAFIMEQWRTGNNATFNEVVSFSYSLDATSLTTGTWTPVTALNLTEILTATSASIAVDGNLPANRGSISGSTSLTWNNGSTLWIKWTDDNVTGSDGLYAIDDLTFTATTTLGTQKNPIPGLNIYPNPVINGTFYVETDANATKSIIIFDVLGKEVSKTTISGNTVNVNNLRNGVYIVKITEEGKTATKKLVIR